MNVLPYGWRALYVIGALPLFLVAYLRRNLPETQALRGPGKLSKTSSELRRDAGAAAATWSRQYPGRIVTILIAAARVSASRIALRQRPVIQISAERLSLLAAGR